MDTDVSINDKGAKQQVQKAKDIDAAMLGVSQINNPKLAPLVTVVIPIFEVEPYLKTCLNSIVNQSYPHLEVILVLKPGADKSCEIAEKYADQHGWNVLYVADDERQGDSRNKGMDIATGDFIVFADSDDWIPPDAYEKMVHLIERTSADVVLGRALRFDSRNRKGWRTPQFERGGIFRSQRVIRWSDYPTLVWNGAPWNKLFRIKYLRDNNVRFPEKIFYEDVGFILDLFIRNPRIAIETSVVYKWRVRDAAVGASSVTQQKDDFENLSERITVYNWVDEQIQERGLPDNLRIAWGERKVIDLFYYLKPYLYGTKYYRHMFREIAPEYLRKISPEAIQRLSKGDRLIAKWIQKETFWKVDVYGELIIAFRHVRSRAVKAIPKPVRAFVKKLGYIAALPVAIPVLLFRALKRYVRRRQIGHHLNLKSGLWYLICRNVFPVNKKKFFWEGVSGRQFAGNEKYLYKKARHLYPNARHVWVFQADDAVKRNERFLEGDIIVKRFGWRYIYHLATSCYLFTATSFPVFYRKRTGTTFVQTWHGTPLKKLGFDIASPSARKLNKNSTENLMFSQSLQWNYFVAPNEFSAEKFASAFKFEGEILRTGYPRNDIFYASREEQEGVVARVRQQFNIPSDKKIALYAPTFRDGARFGGRQTEVQFDLDLEKMRQALDQDWVLIVRAHLLSGGVFDVSRFGSFVRRAFVDEYDDPQELCLAADVLITDYSSIFFDYANTRRPMIYFCPDIDEYASQTRGFYFDPTDILPGPFVSTTDEVISEMLDISSHHVTYQEKYDNLMARFANWEDGKAAERVLKTVVGPTL